jgi:hypothetical protein
MDGRSKSSHYNKKFRTRSMEKQRGMAFGFRKTAVIKPDRWMNGWIETAEGVTISPQHVTTYRKYTWHGRLV